MRGQRGSDLTTKRSPRKVHLFERQQGVDKAAADELIPPPLRPARRTYVGAVSVGGNAKQRPSHVSSESEMAQLEARTVLVISFGCEHGLDCAKRVQNIP